MATTIDNPHDQYSDGAWQLMVAAEKLFGQRGIEAVSLREIAAAANNANNSAVQYHFGSKENLVQAVFEMRMPPLDAARALQLTKLKKNCNPSLRSLLEALLLPVLEVFDNQKLEAFVLFMSRLSHRDNSEHPFFRTARKNPASFEIVEAIAKQFAHLPHEAFSIRLRLATDLFLDSIAEYRRLEKLKTNPYANAQAFWDEVLDMVLAVLQTPHHQH